jgi:hypothetical protein
MLKAQVHGLPMFTNRSDVENLSSQKPLLQVVIDTEEEFDWSKGPDRSKVSVKHLQQLHLVQDIFEQYGLKPCYVVDYPVASDLNHNQLLVDAFRNDKCEIGAHLHPWVNPPYTEPLSVSNMYPGNLPYELEKQKLQRLTDRITETFAFKPVIYKAGRYGFGPNTQQILEELKFQIDLSVCPAFDHSYDGGPDYHKFGVKPFYFGNNLLEIPLTAAYVGFAGRFSNQLFNFAKQHEKFRLPGVFARSGVVDRIVLSPEGFTAAEHVKITQFLLKRNVRFFTWSFHSSSIVVGNTSYVQSQKQLAEFLDRFKRFFDFFFGTLGGAATSPIQFKNLMEKQ